MSFRYLNALRNCSVLFVAVPWIVFLCTWCRPFWAVVLVLLHAYVLYRYFTRDTIPVSDGSSSDWFSLRDRISLPALLVIVLIAVCWVSLSGSGGVGWQNIPDWNNKNVLMNDLLAKPWPVVYEHGFVLNYYFALYLPASLIGRIAGWNAAQWTMYGEALVGVTLTLLWLYSFSGKLGIKVPLIFLVFGGLDVVGARIYSHRWPGAGEAIEFWVRTLQFSSTTTLLYWVPQHALPGWILTSLMLDEATRARRLTYIGLFVGVCALWSPFVTLGLIPVGVAMLFIADRKSLISFANFAYLPAMALLSYVFYSPHASGGEIDAGVAVWARHYAPSNILHTLFFLTLEVGVYLLLVSLFWSQLTRTWRIIAVTVMVASVLWVLAPEEVGHGGFTMRSSIPSLFLLFLLLTHALSLQNQRLVKVALCACLVIGAGSAVQETTRSLKRYPTTFPAQRPTMTVLGLGKRHTNEFIMPMNARLYRLVFLTPAAATDTP